MFEVVEKQLSFKDNQAIQWSIHVLYTRQGGWGGWDGWGGGGGVFEQHDCRDCTTFMTCSTAQSRYINIVDC